MNNYYVYIVSNKKRSTLYVGVTNDLIKRVKAHKAGVGSSFTKKYKLHDLVYFEEFNKPILAIRREKQIKKWNRKWKFDLIKTINPEMEDMFIDLVRINKDPQSSWG